jgi:hypothetical protein
LSHLCTRIPPAEMEGANPISPLTKSTVHGLRDLGWIEGRAVTIERYSAQGDPHRASAILADLVSGQVDVIATGGHLTGARHYVR